MLRKKRLLSFAAAPVLAGAVAAAWSSRPAQALPLAVVEGEALDVSAERLDVDVEHGTALLQGAVSAKLGELTVQCPTVEIRYDGSPKVSWAKGSGGVTAHLKGIDATAATVEFDAASRTIALHGGVRLARGKGWVTAEHATYDIASGKVSLQEVKGSIPVVQPRR